MRTMFPIQGKTPKKRFQKPNILRKRCKKPIKIDTLDVHQPIDTNSLVNKKCVKEVDEDDVQLTTIETHDYIIKSNLDLPDQTDVCEDNKDFGASTSPSEESKLIYENHNGIIGEDDMRIEEEQTNTEDNSNPTLVNIESFFNDSAGEKFMLCDIDFEPGKQLETLVVIDNESPENVMYIEENSDVITSMVPLSEVTRQPFEIHEEKVINPTSFPNIYSEYTPGVKFKCDVPNCTKEFRSEQKYKKHKKTHDKDGSIKTPRQVTVECPVKKVEADGTEKSCGKIFLVRQQLLKHLNEDHTLDEAVYRCEECARRFFWASGLRAHVRAHCRAGSEGAGLVCSWPGCGRVFRQPCRLREHARAHTGDRPYHCDHPNCGWSFRSASKLERHARRHKGERRHACGACGRAFLRREHLRDHSARHHAPHQRRPVPCTHPGCEQTFNNMSTLYLHVKKVHKKQEVVAPAVTATETLYTLSNSGPDMFMVSLAGSSSGLSTDALVSEGALNAEPALHLEAVGVGDDDDDEWHSARTHCTWPLERVSREADAGDAVDANLLKDDSQESQVEQSEGSESTFTVRSDLFLHGNVLINEDSEHMGVGGGGDSLGADLGLLDAHPTIDLMQEELMYADSGADESSFRIFLLSGEETDLPA